MSSFARMVPIGGVGVVRLPPVGPLLLVFRGRRGAMKATPGVLPPRLFPLWKVALLVLGRPSLHAALHVGVGHQVDVAVRVPFETHEHHPWEDGAQSSEYRTC